MGAVGVAHRVVTSDRHPCRPCRNDGCGGGKVSECLTTLPVDRVRRRGRRAAAPRPKAAPADAARASSASATRRTAAPSVSSRARSRRCSSATSRSRCTRANGRRRDLQLIEPHHRRSVLHRQPVARLRLRARRVPRESARAQARPRAVARAAAVLRRLPRRRRRARRLARGATSRRGALAWQADRGVASIHGTATCCATERKLFASPLLQAVICNSADGARTRSARASACPTRSCA